jgi:hypothetical protein
MEFDINEVEEIQVRFVNGDEIIYKGLGLEKIRRLICSSPSLELPKKTVVVEDCDSPELKPRKSTKDRGGASSNTINGYASANLNYATSKGKSAVDIAKEMQRKAEQESGIKF